MMQGFEDAQKSERFMTALLQMEKIDIETLRKRASDANPTPIR
jgi:hypothetical protein